MTTLTGMRDPVMPTDRESRLARDSGQALEAALARTGGEGELRLRVQTSDNEETEIAVPSSAARLLVGALQQMADGRGVALLSVDADLTTQKAADLLRVSRPFLIKLLEEGKIPFRRVGSHRRILARDMLRYGAEEHSRRERVMGDLVTETERLGLYG